MSSSVTITIGNVRITVLLQCVEEEGWTVDDMPGQYFEVPYTTWERDSGKLPRIFQRIQEEKGTDMAVIVRDGEVISGGIDEVKIGDHLRIYPDYMLHTDKGEDIGLLHWSDGEVEVYSPDRYFSEEGASLETLRKIRKELMRRAKNQTAAEAVVDVLRETIEENGGRIHIDVRERREDDSYYISGEFELED